MALRGGDPNRGLKVAFMQVPPFSLTEQLDALGEQLDAAVLQVLRSGQYIGGGVIAAFEQAFARSVATPFAVGCNMRHRCPDPRPARPGDRPR